MLANPFLALIFFQKIILPLIATKAARFFLHLIPASLFQFIQLLLLLRLFSSPSPNPSLASPNPPPPPSCASFPPDIALLLLHLAGQHHLIPAGITFIQHFRPFYPVPATFCWSSCKKRKKLSVS
jgi:hypothetical protein